MLQLFVRGVFGSLRHRARLRYGRAAYECGSVTFIQRFGDALNLNLHFHSIVLDGVYHHEQGGVVRFRRLPPPTNADVERTTRRIVGRLRRLLIARGLTPDADAAAADPLPEDQPFLAEIYAASVRSRIAIGERAGLGVLRIGDLVDPEEAAFVTGPRLIETSIGGELFVQRRTADEKAASARTGESFSVGELRQQSIEHGRYQRGVRDLSIR